MKPKTAMEKNSIREWISVILPVLIWLLLRYAGRNLPPAAQIGLTGFLLVVAAFLYVREKGKSYTVITPDDDFEKIFGRKADKRRKVYNGTLKCQIYMYYK